MKEDKKYLFIAPWIPYFEILKNMILEEPNLSDVIVIDISETISEYVGFGLKTLPALVIDSENSIKTRYGFFTREELLAYFS